MARGRIDIEYGLLPMHSVLDGTVAEVLVKEGDHVSSGDALLRLNSEVAMLQAAEAAAEQEQMQAKLGLLQVRQRNAERRANRLADAEKADAGDGQSADEARAQISELQAQQAAVAATLRKSVSAVEQAQLRVRQHTVLAPADAEVVNVASQIGARASAGGDPLLTLLPDRPRIVRAELNESFLERVQIGMAAEVELDSDDDVPARTAHVVRIGPVFGAATLESDPLIRANARTVECVLEFDRPQNLKIGQRVRVRFVGA